MKFSYINHLLFHRSFKILVCKFIISGKFVFELWLHFINGTIISWVIEILLLLRQLRVQKIEFRWLIISHQILATNQWYVREFIEYRNPVFKFAKQTVFAFFKL